MIRVLSLRGGGIRGIATAVLLSEVERRLNAPLSSAFDLIVGTSVGGIIAMGLALKLPAPQLVDFFESEGPRIFRRRRFGRFWLMLGRPRYQVADLMAALGRHFDVGDVKANLSHVYTKVMVTSTRYRGLEARLWKSWKHFDMPAVVAAASSAAAPTYFGPVDVADFAHADGGLYANNPCAMAAIEAKKLWPRHRVTIIDIACPGDKSQFEPHRGGILDFVPHLSDIFIGSGEDAMSYMARQLLGDAGQVLTIEPPLLSASPDIGDATPGNLRELKKCAEYDMDRNVQDILRVLKFESSR